MKNKGIFVLSQYISMKNLSLKCMDNLVLVLSDLTFYILPCSFMTDFSYQSNSIDFPLQTMYVETDTKTCLR